MILATTAAGFYHTFYGFFLPQNTCYKSMSVSPYIKTSPAWRNSRYWNQYCISLLFAVHAKVEITTLDVSTVPKYALTHICWHKQADGYTEAFIYSTNSTQRNLYSAAVFRKPVNTHFPSQIHPQCIFHSIVSIFPASAVKNWVSSDKTDSIRIFRKGMRWRDWQVDRGMSGERRQRQPPVL